MSNYAASTDDDMEARWEAELAEDIARQDRRIAETMASARRRRHARLIAWLVAYVLVVLAVVVLAMAALT